MAGNIRGHIAGLLQTSKRHTRYVGILALLAVVVAFGVTMGLRRNGRAATITETVLDCHAAAGVAHTHNADCYDADGNLVCPLQERELHVHDDSCYSTDTKLVCGQEEHTHSDACYDEEGNLVCGMQEHTHSDACYETTRTLTCGKEEVTEEHVHGDGCFKTVTTTVEDETADAFKAGKLTASKDGYDVTVSYGADAKVPDDAKLSVKALSENSAEYKAAREAVLAQKLVEDKNFDESTLGMAAVDITILDASGAVIEPSGPVNVALKMNRLPKDVDKSVLNATLEVLHLDESSGDTVVETVAESNEVKVTSNAANAKFTVDSFSTFPLTWDNNEATIHYGHIENGSFVEFDNDLIATLDTSASKVSLSINNSSYSYSSATYVASDGDAPILIDPTLYRTETGWACDMHITGEGDSSTVERRAIANGSDIYVAYTTKQTNPQSGDDVAGPTTTKKVTSNGDGTYTIQLDVVGAEKTEDHSTGANVLIVLDRTTSMTWSMRGQRYQITTTNPQRWATAVSAIQTLVNTLSTGDNAGNDIEYSLVTFYGSADPIYSWSGNTWTKDYSAYMDTIRGLGQSNWTNWEAGLSQGLSALANRDADNTYVIFVTDGEPNRSNTQHYNWEQGWSYVTDAQDEANAIAGSSKVSFYGVFCGGDAGVDNLTNIVRNAGGVKTINGTDSATMQSEFANIAQTIIDHLGSSGVSVDDGVPTLASVSAQTVGEAGAFEYYKTTVENPNDSDFEVWSDAPGASYSSDNGVTWDLSSVGTLADKTTYRVKFTVWPSQEALDLIADLNNGLVTKTDQELKDASIKKDANGVYTLLTNTHLKTTYTYNGNTYTDPSEWDEEAMNLPTEPLSIEKLWPENLLDQYGEAVYRDENGNEQTATSITLTLTRDKSKYLDVTVKASEGWKKDNVYISCGFMTVKNGVVSIKEPGYDYTVTEPVAFSYYWDLIADTYHPMVINGTPTLLVLDETATAADNNTTFEINEKIYKKVSNANNTLHASNYRRSNLNITKAIDGANAPKDTYFEYTVTVKDADATDGNVWFSAWDPATEATVKDADWVISGATAQAGNTGYWYATNGSQIKFKIKAGWNVRFLNLKHGSTFSVEETSVGDGFEFKSIAAETLHALKDPTATWHSETGAKSTGTIVEPNNSYTLTYTNKWITQAFKIQKVDENSETLTGATFTMTSGNQEVSGFNAETLKTNGVIESIELGQGVYCLTETAAPDGYNILENKVYFKIAKDGNSYKASICDADGNAATNDKAQVIDNGLTVQVSNTPGSALPMTGGPGNALFNILGSAIATAAILTYGLLSRRTSEGRSWV